MTKNVEVDFKELERLAKFGGTDDAEMGTQSIISAISAASVAWCVPVSKGVSVAISGAAGVTTIFSCNRTCGC